MIDTPRVVVADRAFAEAPRWHDDRIWFSDFYALEVVSARANGTDLRIEAEVPNQPSGLGWLPDGRLLVVSMRDRRLLRREPDGALVQHADLTDQVGGHLNDMVLDAQGRAYVGTFGFDLMNGAPLEPAPLHRVDPDGTVTKVADDLWFANGMVLTPDNVLLVTETFGNRVSAFDVTDDGRLTNRRIWAQFADLPADRDMAKVLAQAVVAGDGCCLDAEGGLWIADAVGERLIRVVEGGEITEEIMPGSNVFACALGGADGTTLFACVAPDFDESARRAAREGKVIAVQVAVPAGR
jgi:sugar lactone lactonase YvrE